MYSPLPYIAQLFYMKIGGGSGKDADGTCLWPKALLADGGRIRLTCLIENREKAGRMRYIFICV